MAYDGIAMPQNPVPLRKTAPSRKPTEGRKSGTLSLFLPEEAALQDSRAEPAAVPPEADSLAGSAAPGPGRQVLPYARFRFCRGFIDDLNLILPIRVRIRLETEIAKGRIRGQVEGPALRFRWEFLVH
jgi:hypothetical protein